jgi:hypothetical protein
VKRSQGAGAQNAAEAAAAVAEPAKPAGKPDQKLQELAAKLDRPKKRLKVDVYEGATLAYAKLNRENPLQSYLYRCWPVIDLELVNGKGCNTYIDKVGSPITRDWVLKHWGSGKYRQHFNDESRARGSQELAVTVYDISDPDFPPVIEDLRSLVRGDPSNAGYIRGLEMKGLLPRPAGETAQSAESGLAAVAMEALRQRDSGGRGDQGQVLTKALDLMTDASKKAVEVATSGSKPVDPIDQLFRVKKLIDGGESTALMPLVLQLMQQNFELMKASMSGGRRHGGDSLLDNVRSLVELKKAMSELGLGAAAGGSWLDTLLDKAPALLEQLLGPIMVAAKMRGLAGAPGALPGMGAAAPASPAPAAAAAQATPPAGVDPNPGKPFLVERENPMMFSREAVLRKLCVQLTEALAGGARGDQFADAVQTMYGETIYDAIAAMGKAAILEALQGQPNVWSELTPYHEALSQFIDDFIEYGRPPAA